MVEIFDREILKQIKHTYDRLLQHHRFEIIDDILFRNIEQDFKRVRFKKSDSIKIIDIICDRTNNIDPYIINNAYSVQVNVKLTIIDSYYEIICTI